MSADSNAGIAGLLKDTLFSTRKRRVYRYCNYDTRPDTVVEPKIRDIVQQWSYDLASLLLEPPPPHHLPFFPALCYTTTPSRRARSLPHILIVDLMIRLYSSVALATLDSARSHHVSTIVVCGPLLTVVVLYPFYTHHSRSLPDWFIYSP